MTSKHKNITRKQSTIDHTSVPSGRSSKCFQNNDIPAGAPSGRLALESINRYYGYIRAAEGNMPEVDINGCFALRLALFLIDTISKGTVAMTGSGAFSRTFYAECIESAAASELAAELSDPELLLIYIKQCLHLMKAGGIIRRSGSLAEVDPAAASRRALYFRLINSFWNQCRWEDIFPSDIASARALSESRSILKDLIVRHDGEVRLDSVANEFFDLTGFCNKNDLYMISFLDFYFFTWLNHFGLIRYYAEQETSPVHITVTDTGRKILKSL